MSALDAIAVTTEIETGNVKPLLHEIRHALARLEEGGEGTVIDLQSLPLAPGEERRIEETLGKGEVSAELNALGDRAPPELGGGPIGDPASQAVSDVGWQPVGGLGWGRGSWRSGKPSSLRSCWQE